MVTESLLQRALARRNPGRPPVWFMRQAGRYHRHYQRLRARHDFIDLCKRPELAVEVTLGPIEEFGFDAAILFSDLLFPLEAMGMGLRYEPGPKLDWYLRSTADLARLQGGAARAAHMTFQAAEIARLHAWASPGSTMGSTAGLTSAYGSCWPPTWRCRPRPERIAWQSLTLRRVRLPPDRSRGPAGPP